MGRKKAYEADGITVSYEARLCIRAAECVHRLPDVFDPKRRPWIEAGAAGADAVARVVERCPTGALTYALTGQPSESPDEEPSVVVTVDGPIYLRGALTVELPDSTQTQSARIALCRCGKSENKPFCDNSHIEANFRG